MPPIGTEQREAIVLQPGPGSEREVDPLFEPMLDREREKVGLRPIGIADDIWEPFDLRVARPHAIDLQKLWRLAGRETPPMIAAGLGSRVPILLHHRITPFPIDGHAPGGVWSLTYEFLPSELDAHTAAVIPNDEFSTILKVKQQAQIGIDFAGGAHVGTTPASIIGTPIDLGGASIHATAGQSFQFQLTLDITLRKVIGAAVGAGGALWKMYRQDEPIDRPHTLLHTLLVPAGTREFRCIVKTSAVRAGFLGTRLGSRYWPYEDQQFIVDLGGIGT